MRCGFVPPYLLERLASSADPALATCARRTRALDADLRSRREARPEEARVEPAAWQVFTAHNTDRLPGDLVRSAGEPPSGDAAVDEAGAGLTATLELFADLGRGSYDGRGAGVLATVHYGRDYDNAFWDGRQLVFGDGDGRVFDRFTKPIDVLGHELTHALTQHTANLRYADQPGALNESVSDVFGACVKQRVLGQDADSADWLIGEGIFLPGVQGRALRSMSEPGTAYDDPRLGRDPQVGHFEDFVVTRDDNGGVHLNSGIPNKAFHLAATAIGGQAWEGAGRIWFAALLSGLPEDCDFATFASACVDVAGDDAGTVREAWDAVGVPSDGSPNPGEVAERPEAAGGVLVVRRTGGLAGIVREGHVDLDAADDPRARQARTLLDRIDLTAVHAGRPAPDRFVYDVECPPRSARVQETDLTPELAALVRLVLGEG